ncbi:MAG: DUF5711 family protein [Oscillospiraceae bacterium]|nr:DUF5711 family protein [Oscillospiraceae bacterium]
MGTDTKNKQKRRKKRPGLALALKLCLPVIVIFAALFVASKTFGNVALSNVTDVFAEFAAGVRSGGGYSYSLSGQNVVKIDRMESGLLILTDHHLEIVSSGGTPLLSERIGFASPAADVKNGRAVVFDRNGKKLLVTGATKLLYEIKTDFAILDAAVSSNGFVAAATLSKGAASELMVYDRRKQEYFKWQCAAEYIADVAFSRDGKRVAAVVIGVREAELFSRLLIFNISSAEPPASFEYPGTTLIKAVFTAKGSVAVMGDNILSVISPELERTDRASFDSDALSLVDTAENGACALIVLPFGNENRPKLTVYSADLGQSFEKSFDSRAIGLSRSRNHTAVLFRNSAVIYNNAGMEMGKIELSQAAAGISVTDRAVFVQVSDRVQKYSLAGKAMN